MSPAYLVIFVDRLSSAKICNSKSPLHNGLNSKNVLMSYLYAILFLSKLYVTTSRTIICEKCRILTHLFTYSKQTHKCHEFFFHFLVNTWSEVAWIEILHILFFLNKKKSFSWTVFCFHYTKIKFKAWQIYYIKKWWCTGGPTWIIPVQ